MKEVSKMRVDKSVNKMVVENLKEILALIESGTFTVNDEDTEALYKVSLSNAIIKLYKSSGEL